MPAGRDVVILGGGITGCAVARVLSRRGLSVTIIEQEAVASKASGVAAGLLPPFYEFEKPGPLTDLALKSLSTHRGLGRQLREETGIDARYTQLPFLYLAFTKAEEEALRSRLAWQRATGLRIEVVDNATAREVEPRLTREAPWASLSLDEAQVEAYSLTLAYAADAERHGAQFVYAEVTGLRPEGHRVAAVRTARGEIPCGQVVVAMGPWSCVAGEWLGVPIPVSPLKGQIVILRPPGGPLKAVVMHHLGYLATKPIAGTLAGTTEEEVGYDAVPTSAARKQIMSAVLRLMPSVEAAEVVRMVAGLRPITPDRLPIFGRAPGWDNAIIAAGAGRNGVLLSPVTAEIVAALATGENPGVDLTPFRPERFV
ncbi:MAG: FAD-dependent oxidoreductase [Chloroflexi bacterium]|nr:FAD-dependent oxidoreductase [Chloroflexota bacterium]